MDWLGHWASVAIRTTTVTWGEVDGCNVMNTAVPIADVASILTVPGHTSELNSLGSVVMAR